MDGITPIDWGDLKKLSLLNEAAKKYEEEHCPTKKKTVHNDDSSKEKKTIKDQELKKEEGKEKKKTHNERDATSPNRLQTTFSQETKDRQREI